MTKPDSLRGKISVTLFALLFAVGFTAGGIAAGVLPMYKQFSGWWKAGSFVPVSAMVVSTGLESRSYKGSATHRVQAEFSYDYQGNNHISHRIGLDDGGFDNIGSYHTDIYEQLSQARDSLSLVTLWVNPQHPDEALYDRSLRWMKVIFLIPFAVLFPAVGLGAWWVIWRIWRNNDIPQYLNANLFRSDRSVISPNASWVIQGSGGGLIGASIACAFWNILSWPIAILFFNSAKAAPWWATAIVSIFPVIGLMLLFKVLKIMHAQRRIGEPVLTLDGPGTPGSIPLQGKIQFNPAFGAGMISAEMTHDVKVTVEYVRDDRRGENGGSTTLWQGQAMQAQLIRGTQSLNFKFDLPTDLQASPSHAGKLVQEYFQVVLEALGGTVKFRLPEDAVKAVAFPEQQVFQPQSADELPVKAAKVVASVRWVANALTFAFVAYFLWIAVTQFVIPMYQSAHQKPQTVTQSSTANQQVQLPPIHAPIRLDSWAGNGFGVVGRVAGNMTIGDRDVQLFPESIELRSSGGCAPDCPVIRSVAFLLSKEGDDSFSVLAQSAEIAVLEELPNGPALSINIPADQLPIRLKFTDRSQLAGLRLTLAISGSLKEAGKFTAASWYTHSESLASELSQKPVQLQLAAGTEQLQGQAQQAVREGRFADLQQLLQAGVDANALDAEGQTMLMRAADRGDLKSVKLLLANGAQVNAKTAVDQEGRGAHTALHDAMRLDAVDVVDALVKAGADPRAKANQFWTPMHYAAYLGAVQSIRYLHQHGVSIDEPFSGARGSTPLMIAAQYGQVRTIRVLLELGADPVHRDIYNEDACGYARYFKMSTSFEALGCK